MLRVFFVDDEENVLRSFRRLLQLHRDRYNFTFFSNPLDAAAAEVPDVLITDEGMPGLSGLDLISRVREKKSETVTILITGQVSIDNSVEPPDHFLEKPCQVQDILSILDGIES
jgi:FixJ family two-component response regulator